MFHGARHTPESVSALIADEYRDWSDCAGDLEARWDKDGC